MPKNKITTQGYFIRRLRNEGFHVSCVYDRYSDSNDRRRWTVVVNPGTDSIFITCVDKGDWPNRGMYRIDDNGSTFPVNFYINTESIDVVIKHFTEFKVQKTDNHRVNNFDGKKSKPA